MYKEKQHKKILINWQKTAKRKKEAYAICEEKIRLRELPMKLISVEYTLDVNKIIFTLLLKVELTLEN